MRTILFLASFSVLAIASPQVLNLGNGAEPKDLDPDLVSGVPENNILINLFEGLVTKDPKTLKILPGVAAKWEISEDGKTYTFHLRKNARWSDGTPLTAQDVVYSWTRLLDPKTASEFPFYAYYVTNGEAFNKGTLKDASKLGIKAIDDKTLKVTLVNPTSYFLSLLTQPCLAPLPQKVIEKFGKNWTRPENIVSNGAFLLADWKMNQVVKLKKNPKYWDAAHVKLDEVNFMAVENERTEENMFRTNQLDLTAQVPIEKLEFWQKDKSGALQSYDYLGTYFYRLNTKKPPLTDKRVRKALALAINRHDIVTFVTKANQVPATAFTPPNTGGYSARPALPADLSRLSEAKKLLADAGFPEGKGMPALEIVYNTNEGHKKIAEAIQQMLTKNLGVNVTLVNQEWKVVLNTIKSLNYQMARAGWIGNYNDPNTFLELFISTSVMNQTGWGNQAFDDFMARAEKEKNPNKRFDLLRSAEDLLLEDLPVIPIYYYKRACLKAPRVLGWHPNIEDLHPLKYVSIAP